MATDTTYTLDQFLADTRHTIKTKGIPAGLAEIRGHLEKLLHNPELLKKHLGDPPPYTERTTIGYDPETDVHVLLRWFARRTVALDAAARPWPLPETVMSATLPGQPRHRSPRRFQGPRRAFHVVRASR